MASYSPTSAQRGGQGPRLPSLARAAILLALAGLAAWLAVRPSSTAPLPQQIVLTERTVHDEKNEPPIARPPHGTENRNARMTP
jgi:hypothetical protein